MRRDKVMWRKHIIPYFTLVWNAKETSNAGKGRV
jgi:hypothetical protein